MNPIPYGRQQITEADIKEVEKVLRSDFLTGGPNIQKFEEAFAAYIGAKYAVAVSSGTAALHLCAIALGVTKESKVITTSNTFSATANCVLYCGGEVDLVEIDPETALIDPEAVQEKLASSLPGTYEGIIAVDFAGRAVDLEKMRSIADRYNCWLLEDACHAPGGFFIDSQGRKQFCGNGSFADLAIFSFHPVKHIACGEGGMITTNDENRYKQLLMLRTHGITRDRHLLKQDHGGWYYEMQQLGYNYRLSDIHAILGLSQLSRADENLKIRKSIARHYDDSLKDAHINPLPPDQGHAYHLYVIQVAKRKTLYNYLREHQIFAQVHYIPIHLQPFYQKNFGWKKGDLPLTEAYYNSCLSLPIFPSLKTEQQAYVIEKLLEFG